MLYKGEWGGKEGGGKVLRAMLSGVGERVFSD